MNLDPTGITGVASAGLDAIASVAKKLTQHEAINNSPELQKAAYYQLMQEHLDEIRKAIAEEDLETVRKLMATASPPQ